MKNLKKILNLLSITFITLFAVVCILISFIGINAESDLNFKLQAFAFMNLGFAILLWLYIRYRNNKRDAFQKEQIIAEYLQSQKS